jgi:hypothetical protein
VNSGQGFRSPCRACVASLAAVFAAILAVMPALAAPAWRAANTNAAAAWTRAQRIQSGSNRWVAAGVMADRGARCVTFVAEATGLERGAPVEFLAVEQASDRDYESLTVALVDPSDLSQAIEYLGVPHGLPVKPAAFRFWPKGERVIMSVAPFQGGAPEPVGRWVRDKQANVPFDGNLVYVGAHGAARAVVGARDVPDTSPGAVAATYNEPTTLLDVPVQAQQGDVYGSRVVGERTPGKGDLLLVTLQPENRPAGQPRVVDVALTAQPAADSAPAGLAGVQIVGRSVDPAFPALTNDVRGAFQRLATLAQAGRDPFVALALDDRLTVATARDLAQALSAIEGSNGIRIDAPPPGQLYYKAFLPQAKWRERKDRLSQPWELRLTRTADGWSRVLVEIREDWSKAGQLDPDLTVVEHPFTDWNELPARIKSLGGGLNTLLVFAPADAPLSAFMPGVRAVHGTQPIVFIFAE